MLKYVVVSMLLYVTHNYFQNYILSYCQVHNIINDISCQLYIIVIYVVLLNRIYFIYLFRFNY